MERLFVYGTLQPGGPNEHVLNEIGGDWSPAVVTGRLLEAGWGAGMGYPGLVLDPSGETIPGHVFTSDRLTDHWDELDEFEGAEYQRTLAWVRLNNAEEVEAYIYVLRNPPALKP